MSDESGNTYYEGPNGPERDNRGECRSCKADILWIKSRQKDGTTKNVPVNAVARMMWVLVESNNPTYGSSWKLVKAFESHFVTCPDADKFRKKKVGP
jgi:hypothetical protein